MHYKYYKNIKSSSNLSLSPTQIELELRKPNQNPTKVLKMIVQAHSNFELGLG